MDDFERIVNGLSDDDKGWWPFLFVRPELHEKMTDARVLLLAALYGVFVGVLANVATRFFPHATPMSPLAFPLLTTLSFFVVYRFSFAVFWNRRAARLAESGARPSPHNDHEKK